VTDTSNLAVCFVHTCLFIWMVTFW